MAKSIRLELGGVTDLSAPNHGSIFFVGTATTIIRYGGFTVLTDPNFLHAGRAASLGWGLHSTRLTNPALDIDQLPPLDLCLLSHMHGDHWDEVARDNLRKDLPIVTTPHAAAELRRQKFTDAQELHTWDDLTVLKHSNQLKITAMPGQHGRGVVNALLPPVMGSMLDFSINDEPSFRAYISGDTIVFDQLFEIPRRFPNIDLGIFHLGGTMLLGLAMVTMDAAQGVTAINIIRPRVAIPVHYNDYPIFKSSLEDFMREVQRAKVAAAVHYLRHGDYYTFETPPPRLREQHPGEPP